MKICVLVKEVPDAAVQKRLSNGRMDRGGEKNLNPYDTHAIEEAVRIKEAGNVTSRRSSPCRWAPSPPTARSARPSRSASTAPCTCATRPSPAPTSPPRASPSPRRSSRRPRPRPARPAVRRRRVLHDRRLVADHLKMPSLTQVIKMDVNEGALTCERQAEYGYDTVEIPTPAVISVGDAINEPRYPSLKAIMGAKKKPVDKKTIGDVGLDADRRSARGLQGQVVRVPDPPERPPARSSRTRTPTRRSSASSPGSTRGS